MLHRTVLLVLAVCSVLWHSLAQAEEPVKPKPDEAEIAELLHGIIAITRPRPAFQPPSAIVIVPDDHPRLAHFIKHGIVRRAPPRRWGCEQAAGKPDTFGAGDIVTAWASSTQDDQDEWLELTYEDAIKPAEVHVVETYNPGALFKVTTSTKSGMEVVLWKGDDPTPPDVAEGRGTSIVKVTAGIKTIRIRIHLASKKVQGWNEIDAVGIKDTAGRMHWAKSVQASSNYAGGPAPGWILDPAVTLKRLEELEDEVERLRKVNDER